MWNKDKVAEIIGGSKLVIFAKGTRHAPQCGFSARAFTILDQIEQPYEVVDIFEHPAIRPALVEHSSWPTTPQIFLGGELLGGSDILFELFESGELKKKADAAFAA
jgi:monothiol glutaredoxin